MWQWCFSMSLWLSVGSASAPPSSPILPALQHPFLIGAEWQDGASPAVKDLFWETGCNFARLTGGGYGWAVDTHRHALAELNQHGVQVLLQLGSHYPDGHYFDFKEAYFVDQNGKAGIPNKQSWAVEYDGAAWPQYSYASPKFRSEIEKDFTSYLEKLGATPNLEALLLHNEPGYFWLDNRLFDYSQSSIDRFRQWLPTQHSSIGELNRKWGSSFASFDRVEPPRDVPPTSSAAWMDWRRSNILSIQEFLEGERYFTQKLKPGIPATTNLAGPIDDWFPIRLADNFRFTQNMDIASVDIYPGAEWSSRFFPGYTMDMTRGAANGKRVYVAECESYAPAHFPKLSDEQRADRLRSDLWTYIGHGANGVLVWTLNGQDGFKLTNGEFNPRLATLRETAHVAKMLNLGAFSKPARQVALVIDQDSSLLPQGKLLPHAWAAEAYKTTLGMYGILANAHIEVDVITTDMVRAGGADKYRSLVFSKVETMDAILAQRIKSFVTKGGLIIADGTFGGFDKWGQRAVENLSMVFGAQVLSTNRDEQASLSVDGSSIQGKGRNKLALRGGKPLAEFSDGTPSVVLAESGKGHTILLATNVGPANSMTAEPGTAKQFASWLSKYASVAAAGSIENSNGYLDVTRLSDANGNSLLVVSNPPNQSEPAKTYSDISALLPHSSAQAQSFLFVPSTTNSGKTISGPTLIHGQSWNVSTFTSHAVILTARNHSPLLATVAPVSVSPKSRTSVAVTIYNPSPLALSGELTMAMPQSWKSDRAKQIKVAPYGSSTVTMDVQCGPASIRDVLKARLTTKAGSVDSLPFDVIVK